MSQEPTILSHIIPSISDWPITKFSEDRDGFVERLVKFTYDRLIDSKHDVLELLNKTVYLERQRVKNNPWSVDPQDEKAYWNSLVKEIEKTKTAENPVLEQQRILRRIVNRYSEEVLGYFIPKTFEFSRKFLTAFFKRLFNNGWGRGHRFLWGSKKDLQNKIILSGHLDEIRALFNKGTVVIVPTHYSNLDSIMLGYAIDSNLGIPAFSFGAGLNLYDYEVMAYFMNRLGAYRVDRRKKNPIYLETLKSMASLSLIEGLNHIFFPGGTRSRSGAIEDKLKLGLLNSVIDAQRHCILNQINQKIFIVPVTLGYHFVLEASSLIHQHLKSHGREKYSGRYRPSSIFKTVRNFLFSLRRNDSEVYLSFGKPMDVLGNKVDIDGFSFDDRGNEIDISKYFSDNDIPNEDIQRESVYTRILAQRVIESFKLENVILSSHLCAYVAFELIEAQNPELDLFGVLQINPKNISISYDKFKAVVKRVVKELKNRADKKELSLSYIFKEEDIDIICKDGLKHLGLYHQKEVLKISGKSELLTEDLKLLYYYHNKLVHYNIKLN